MTKKKTECRNKTELGLHINVSHLFGLTVQSILSGKQDAADGLPNEMRRWAAQSVPYAAAPVSIQKSKPGHGNNSEPDGSEIRGL